MTYQERQAASNLIAGLIIFGVYFVWLLRAIDAGSFDGQNASVFAGRAICVLMFGGVIFTIVFTILFNIIVAIVTNDPDPSMVVDERDRMLELKAIRFSHGFIGLGFIACMVALALGVNLLWVLQYIVLSFAIGSLMESVLVIILYRWSAL